MPTEPPAPPPLLVSQKEAARLLCISERTLYALVRRGELSQVKVGPRGVRYDVNDLKLWIEAAKGQPAAV